MSNVAKSGLSDPHCKPSGLYPRVFRTLQDTLEAVPRRCQGRDLRATAAQERLVGELYAETLESLTTRLNPSEGWQLPGERGRIIIASSFLGAVEEKIREAMQRILGEGSESE